MSGPPQAQGFKAQDFKAQDICPKTKNTKIVKFLSVKLYNTFKFGAQVKIENCFDCTQNGECLYRQVYTGGRSYKDCLGYLLKKKLNADLSYFQKKFDNIPNKNYLKESDEEWVDQNMPN